MNKVRAFIPKIFNPFLISRFLAKNIDLLLGQLAGVFILILALKEGLKLDPLSVSLAMALITIICEALSLYYFHVTPGKFFMGLRVYPSTLKDSFKRSFSCYFRALGLGIPVLGLGFSLGYYLLGINQRAIPWDKYGAITQQRKHFFTGMAVSALVVNLLILIVVSSLRVGVQSDNVMTNPNNDILETVVDYPGFEDLSTPFTNLTEEEQSISDVWNMACRLGAVGVLDYYKGPLINSNISIISGACERGIKQIEDEDEIELIYLKACEYGIGVGAALMFKDDIYSSPINKDAEKLLREICIPDLNE